MSVNPIYQAVHIFLIYGCSKEMVPEREYIAIVGVRIRENIVMMYLVKVRRYKNK
jgi:hypothetical protein